MLRYNEPDETGNNIICRIREEDAIKRQKNVAARQCTVLCANCHRILHYQEKVLRQHP